MPFDDHHNVALDRAGNVIHTEVVEVDVTAEVRGGHAEQRVRAAIHELLQLRDLAAGRPALDQVNNVQQVNTQLTRIDNQLAAAADGITLLADVLALVLRFDVLPDLLVDDLVSGDLDP